MKTQMRHVSSLVFVGLVCAGGTGAWAADAMQTFNSQFEPGPFYVLLKNRPELGATFGGELRCLRAIVYTVIQPMVERLL